MACCVVGGQTGHIRVTTERRLGNSHGSHLLRGLWRLITELELTIVTTQYSASLKHLHQLRNPQQTCLWLLLLLMNKYLTFEFDRVCTGKHSVCVNDLMLIFFIQIYSFIQKYIKITLTRIKFFYDEQVLHFWIKRKKQMSVSVRVLFRFSVF